MLSTGKAQRVFDGHRGLVRSVVFSSSGEVKGSASSSEYPTHVILWDPANDRPHARFDLRYTRDLWSFPAYLAFAEDERSLFVLSTGREELIELAVPSLEVHRASRSP